MSPFRLILALVVVTACKSTSASDGNGVGDVDACKACVADREMAWCPETQTCDVIVTSTCALTFISDRASCSPPQGDQPTKLAVDCRAEGESDPRCDSSSPPGTAGHGVNIDSFDVLGGFVDTANHRLVLAMTCGLCAHPQTGVIAIDLDTGDRTLMSGYVEDPISGTQSVGTGDMPSSLDDVELAPNGKWWALDNITQGAEIFEIDPATGNRTLLYTQAQLDQDTSICTIDGYGMNVGWEVPTASASGNANMIVHPDGTIFLRAERGGTPNEDLGIQGIVALSGGTCRVVTAWAFYRPDIFVGSGPAIGDYYSWFVDHAGKIIGVNSRYSLHEIDPVTGNRTMLASSNPGGLVGNGPDLGIDFTGLSSDGKTVVSNGSSFDAGLGVIAADLSTGERDAYKALGGPQTHSTFGPLYPHPTLDGVYIEPSLGQVTLFEPASGNSILLSR